MSSVIIPKEQLTAFERWELASFEPNLNKNSLNKIRKHGSLSTVSELENIRQEAHDEGYALGQKAGYTAGIQQAQAEAAKIHTLLQNIQEALNQLDEQVAQSLLDLSLEVARKMVIEVIQIKPETILAIIREAISTLPHFNQNAHLILHPDDAELVKLQMGEQLAHGGWKIFTDMHIQRGGCRVETPHSNVDAGNDKRWQRIVGSIGQDSPWLK